MARRVYNANVRDYRNALETVPQMWFARFGTFPAAEFFQATEGDREQPRVGDLLPGATPATTEIPATTDMPAPTPATTEIPPTP